MLRFADGFQIYGTSTTGKTNMLRGNPWAENGSSGPSTLNPHGLQTHSYLITSLTGTTVPMRCLFLTTETVFGMGAFFYLNQLPGAASRFYLFQPRDTANVAQCTLSVSTAGAIELRNGTVTGTVLAQSADGVISAGTYLHVEARFTINDTTGDIEVRVNGVTVLTANGLDTKATANAGCNQVVIGRVSAPDSAVVDVSDFMWWDTTNTDGAGNNTFLGEVQWIAKLPTADTATTDWVRNTGSNDFDMIKDATPDDDTTYISAANVSDASIFAQADLPGTVSEVIAVLHRTLSRKTDPGISSLKQSAVSGVSVADGATYALSETWTYYTDAFGVDPATGVRWTPSGFNASQKKFTKAA